MIVAAAVKFRDKIYQGRWHIEPLTQIRMEMNVPNCTEDVRLEIVKAEQGFLTDTGEFLDRKDALEHVLHCGQDYYPEGHVWKELFSEHIFPPDSFR